MSVKFDVTKRIEWLKKRMTITELDEEYIRLQIMEAIMEALEKGQSLPIDSVSKCACPPLVACEICGEEKGLDGDFWKNKKKHDC